MKKDLYCLVGRDSGFRDFQNEPSFVPLYHYDPIEYSKLLENEFGRLDLQNVSLKILIDSCINKNCPWCGCEEKNKLVVSKTCFPNEDYQSVCSVCANCKARGPVITVNKLHSELNPEAVDDYLDQRWIERISNLK